MFSDDEMKGGVFYFFGEMLLDSWEDLLKCVVYELEYAVVVRFLEFN